MDISKARVEKILGEISEAHKEEATQLLKKFEEEERVGVAEFLADASARKKFRAAVVSLRQYTGTPLSQSTLFELYRSLKLQPSGAERS